MTSPWDQEPGPTPPFGDPDATPAEGTTLPPMPARYDAPPPMRTGPPSVPPAPPAPASPAPASPAPASPAPASPAPASPTSVPATPPSAWWTAHAWWTARVGPDRLGVGTRRAAAAARRSRATARRRLPPGVDVCAGRRGLPTWRRSHAPPASPAAPRQARAGRHGWLVLAAPRRACAGHRGRPGRRRGQPRLLAQRRLARGHRGVDLEHTAAATTLVLAPLGHEAEPVAAVARCSRPAVVQIQTPDGLGSGIVYDSSGLIVTNAHVVGQSGHVQVTLSTGRTSTARWSGPTRRATSPWSRSPPARPS